MTNRFHGRRVNSSLNEKDVQSMRENVSRWQTTTSSLGNFDTFWDDEWHHN